MLSWLTTCLSCLLNTSVVQLLQIAVNSRIVIWSYCTRMSSTQVQYHDYSPKMITYMNEVNDPTKSTYLNWKDTLFFELKMMSWLSKIILGCSHKNSSKLKIVLFIIVSPSIEKVNTQKIFAWVLELIELIWFGYPSNFGRAVQQLTLGNLYFFNLEWIKNKAASGAKMFKGWRRYLPLIFLCEIQQ